MKKLMASIAALAMISSNVTAVSSNAIAAIYKEGSLNDCIKLNIEDYPWLISPYEEVPEEVFLEYNGKDNIAAIHEIQHNGDTIYISYDESIEGLEQEIVEIIKSVNEKFDIKIYNNSKQTYSMGFDIVDEDGKYVKMSVSELKKLHESLDDKTDEIVFISEEKYIESGYFKSLTSYCLNDENKEKLEKYISENNIDANINVYKTKNSYFKDSIEPVCRYYLTVDFKDDITATEHMSYVKEFYDNLNISPFGLSPASEMLLEEPRSFNMNFVNGDTNEDGDLTIADSVAVLQFIGNPDKYALTAQAEFNADVDGIDGITGTDAFVIQQMELKNK